MNLLNVCEESINNSFENLVQDTTSDIGVVKSKRAPRKKVPALKDRQKNYSKEFSGFSVKISRDEIGKKKLSNRLTISVEDARSQSVINITLREAKSLSYFLNRYLEKEKL